jgi:hypothetical protein
MRAVPARARSLGPAATAAAGPCTATSSVNGRPEAIAARRRTALTEHAPAAR